MRNPEREIEQLQERPEQAFRLRQRQAQQDPQAQRALDHEVVEDLALAGPLSDHLVMQPQGDGAAGDQASIVGWPVLDPILRFLPLPVVNSVRFVSRLSGSAHKSSERSSPGRSWS